VAASGSSRRGEATGEEVRWPSDEDDIGLDHNTLGLSGLTQLYRGANRGLCIALLNRTREPPFPSPPPFFIFSFRVSPPLGACEREVHNLRELCKNSRDCCANGGPNHLVSSGTRFVKTVSCVHLVLHEFVFALFLWRLDSSF
jgi:hypothetical protein